MMPSCPYYVLSTPSSLNMWTCLRNLVFAWGQARSKFGGVDTSILHHAFMLIFIDFWAVILLVVPYLCIFSLILQGLFEEGEFRQLEFWTRKGANPSPLFCTSPNALKIYVDFFWNILKILGERTTRGGPPGPHKPPLHHHPLVAVGKLVGTSCASRTPFSCGVLLLVGKNSLYILPKGLTLVSRKFPLFSFRVCFLSQI